MKVERESPCRPEKRGAAGGDTEEQREIRKRIRKVEDSERGSEEEDEDEEEEEDMDRRRADRSVM